MGKGKLCPTTSQKRDSPCLAWLGSPPPPPPPPPAQLGRRHEGGGELSRRLQEEEPSQPPRGSRSGGGSLRSIKGVTREGMDAVAAERWGGSGPGRGEQLPLLGRRERQAGRRGSAACCVLHRLLTVEPRYGDKRLLLDSLVAATPSSPLTMSL